jgi:hypothetical protein
VLCGTLRPGYSHAAQFISELGAAGTPHAALMNLGGFIPSGLLIGIFGAGLALAGGFPCAPGCPQDAPTAHDGLSIAAFLAAIAGFVCAALSEAPVWSHVRQPVIRSRPLRPEST